MSRQPVLILTFSICLCFAFCKSATKVLGFQASAGSSDLLIAEQAAFRSAVQRAESSVVQIETFGGVDSTEQQIAAEGVTTGIVVDPAGWIVTSLHSFRQAPHAILVSLPDGSRAPARLVSRDFSREIALLKVDSKTELPIAEPGDVSALQVGQWCVAVGKTYDNRSVTQSVGIVSALGRAYGRAVQTDAKVSPVNYGGPLIDLSGKVLGVLTPIAAAEMLEEDGAMLYDSGIGFAIPLSDILDRLETLKSGKEIRTGRLGVVLESQNELVGPVKLMGAAPGSPAARAGAQAGDLIVQAEGRPIELIADLRAALAPIDAGNTFHFSVKRGGELLNLACELVAEVPIYRRRYLGIQLEVIEQGLRISHVIAQSPAEKSGLKVDQIIVRCNDRVVQSPQGFNAQLSVAELDSPLKLSVIEPTGQQREIPIEVATWPQSIIDYQPSKRTVDQVEVNSETKSTVKMAQLKLADIANTIHLITPEQTGSRPLGCLMLFPEPGTQEPEKLKSNWEELSRSYGWIIVVPTSVDAKNWTRDEAVELPERILARLNQEFRLDKSRMVAAGIGIGGQLAIRAALGAGKLFNGVLTIQTTIQRFPVPRPNMPMESIDFLFIGPQMDGIAKRLNSIGFVANTVDPTGLDATKWNTVPSDLLYRWLESLGYF